MWRNCFKMIGKKGQRYGMNGPDILEEEVKQAIRQMKREKAEDGDGLLVEMLEAAADSEIEKL